jgi:hypothetical protein
MKLPVFADMTVGSSIELGLTIKNHSGVVVSSPTLEVLGQFGDNDPFDLVVVNGTVTFEPENVGTYKLSVRVTAPIKAVREGLVRVAPSVIT